MAKRLTTDRAVRNVKTQGRHPVGETLYLMVWPSGRKSWVQRLAIKGGRKDRGLGPYPAVSLAQARERAQANRSLVKAGGNLLAAKEEADAGHSHLRVARPATRCREPPLLEERQARGAVAFEP